MKAKKSAVPQKDSNEILDYLKNKIINLAESFQTEPSKIAEIIAFSSRFYNYSFRNKMLIFAKNPHATFVASYKRWNDEFGCNITSGKGSSIKILKPVVATLFHVPGSEKWTPLKMATKLEKEKIKTGEYETKTYTRFKPVSIFDISQTDCPKENYPLFYSMGHSSKEQAGIYSQLKTFMQEKGIGINEVDLQSISLRGNFVPALNSININHLLEDTQKLSTLAHEIGHALLHNNIDEDLPIQQKEFEADAFCIMLESEFGFPLTDTRKEHLAAHYKKIKDYNDAHSGHENAVDILKSLDNVCEVYNSFINEFQDYLNLDREQGRAETQKESSLLLEPIKESREYEM